MSKVSIIVPTYNVEPYLQQCMESIVNQTLRDIEIICIDDGSKDNSGKILDEYAAKDSRIKVIHKENGGYGKAMNIGLDNATSEYIGIVEPDDFIELDMFEVLYNQASDKDLDFIKADYFIYTSIPKPKNVRLSPFCKEKIYDKVINPNKHLETFNGEASIWSAIYKKSFLTDAGIRFLETPGASFQDTSFWIKVLFEAQKAVFINKAFYHYRCDNENSSVKDHSKLYCICDEIKELENRYKSPEQIQIINALKIDKYTWNYNRLTEEAQSKFFMVYKNSLKEVIDKKLYMPNLIPNTIIDNCERILSAKFISIIVPVHNTEKYLRQCIDSLINQTLENIEIICIYDCSTDNSLSILKEYALRDSRVKIIALEKNLKQGGARNRGLDISNGKYIMFVDSDDYIAQDCCEVLYNLIEKNPSDIVISNLTNVVSSQNEKLLEQKIKFDTHYQKTSLPQGKYKYDLNTFPTLRSGPVAKLYKKSIIDNYKIRFPEKLINEDEAFFWFYMTNIKSLYMVPDSYYFRTIHEESTMYSRNINKEGIEDFLQVLFLIYKHLKSNNKFKYYKEKYKNYFNIMCRGVLYNIRDDENLTKALTKKIDRMKYKCEIKNPFEQIFSMTNYESCYNKWYKVIRILGIKISFRNKKKEAKMKLILGNGVG